MPRVYKAKSNLVSLQYSPTTNPLVIPQEIQTRKRLVKAGRDEQLINATTGETKQVSRIYTLEEKDDTEFVKIFAAGITAAYDLTKTAQKVFQVILEQYQKTPMKGGYADSVTLFWFGDGIAGEDIGMSQYTFNRGLRELLDKQFVAPRTPSTFWINPALFFKGDRVQFINEYRRKRTNYIEPDNHKHLDNE